MHGTMLAGYHVLKQRYKAPLMPGWLAVVLTFALVSYSWVLFRVKVVATVVNQAAVAQNLEAAVVDGHRGSIEGTAPEVINPQKTLLTAGRVMVMDVLDAGRGRLVEHADNLEAGTVETLQSQEALIAVGIRRHRDPGLVNLSRGREIGARCEVLAQPAQILAQQLQQRLLPPVTQRDRVPWSMSAQQRFQRRQPRPAEGLFLFGIEPKHDLAVTPGNSGRGQYGCETPSGPSKLMTGWFPWSLWSTTVRVVPRSIPSGIGSSGLMW